jgi:hypothetical protein
MHCTFLPVFSRFHESLTAHLNFSNTTWLLRSSSRHVRTARALGTDCTEGIKKKKKKKVPGGTYRVSQNSRIKLKLYIP